MTTTADIKCAHELRRDGSSEKIRMLLFSDGAIQCCAIDSQETERCCYTSPPGEEETYWAIQDFLTSPSKGYKLRAIEEVDTNLGQRPCVECKALEDLKSYITRRREKGGL